MGTIGVAVLGLLLSAGSQLLAAPRVLPGHVPERVRQLTPTGSLPPDRHLRLAIGLPLRRPEALDRLLGELYDPSSPRYRQFLTPAEFADQFGPTEVDYQSVAAFMSSNGLAVCETHPNRVVLDVEGSAAAVERVLGVKLRVYQHPDEARAFFAAENDPVVDSAIPVLTIGGLSDYARPRPMHRKRTVGARPQGVTPRAGSGPSGSYRGGDFRAAYVPGTTLRGTGQSVGLLQFDGFYSNDIALYASQAGLPMVPLVTVPVDGGIGTPGVDNSEVALDIEMAMSMAPGLTRIIVYEAPNPSPWVDLLSRMANDNLARQLSCSWGGGSPDATAEQVFKQMAAQGQTFFNASGDSDAFTSSIPFPSDSTNITQVGGTTLTTTGPLGTYVSEVVWNWGLIGSSYVGSSGGISTYYAMPFYQAGISMVSNKGSTAFRNVPDVALTADEVYVIYDNGSWNIFGGTSCAAPLWAGLMALVNQQAYANGNAPVGFLNPVVYGLGKGTNYARCFHDITVGDNTSASSPSKFYAVPGYDLCTGWGTPNGPGLIDALAGPLTNARPVMVDVRLTDAPGGNGDGILDPGETIAFTTSWTNMGTRGSNVLATLSTATPGVSALQPGAAYPDMLPETTVSNPVAYAFRLSKSLVPGTVLAFTNILVVNTRSFTGAFSRVIGLAQPQPAVTNTVDLPSINKSIPDLTTIYASNTVTTVAPSNILIDVNVSLRLDHTYDGDLVIGVQHPDGTEVLLSNQRGGSRNNFGKGTGATMVRTVFDDQATVPIASGTPPFSGTFRPDGALSNLNGKAGDGLWRLRVTDTKALDTGTLYAWGLVLVSRYVRYAVTLYNTPPVATNLSMVLPMGAATNLVLTGSDPDNDPITFRTNSAPLHGALSGFDPASGALTYTPVADYTGTDSFTFVSTDGYTNSTTATVTLVMIPATRTVTVASAWSTPDPPVGATAYPYGATVACAMGTAIVPEGLAPYATQYVCTGWSLDGGLNTNGQAAATGASLALVLTNDATLTWAWSTQYLLSVAATSGGTVNGSNGWQHAGADADMTATASNYFHFLEWAGDVPAGDAAQNPLRLVMTGAVVVQAWFAADTAPLGTPDAWLAQYGLTNGFADAETNDVDGDGMAAWQEYVAGTDPTNAASVFVANGLQRLPDIHALVLTWPSLSNRFYGLEGRTNLVTGVWTNLAVDLPATPPENSWTDSPPVNDETRFYRLDVRQAIPP